MSVVRALITAHIDPYTFITQGEIWDADDPVVKKHRQHFSDDLDPIARRSVPVIEEATAEPGTRRPPAARTTARR